MTTEITLSFREVLSALYGGRNNITLNRFTGGKYKSSNVLSKNMEDILGAAYEYDFSYQAEEGLSTLPFVVWNSDEAQYEFTENFNNIVTYLFRQYGDSYCVNVPSLDDSDVWTFCVLFLDSFMDILFQTYDKYDVLFKSYNAQKAKLLDGVKFSSKDISLQNGSNSGSNSYSGYNKYKDTPQGSVSLEDLGDDYNTNVSINENQGSNSGSFSSNGTLTRSSEDQRETPIDRLRELEEKYSKLYENWGNEFLPLFWEV